MALGIVEQVGLTDVGRQRSANEDSLVLRPPFFAVADGMGGARAGEVASAIAAEAFEGARDAGEAAEAQLARLLREANRRIYDLAVTDESRRGMGTTLTAAKVHERRGEPRARGRQPGVPPARRRARADHARPLPGGGARALRPDHGRGGRAPPAALDHHARPRPRAGRGGRHLHAERPRRRPVPALLRRADVDDLRRRGRGDPAHRGDAGRRGRGPDQGRQPERRQGQHHGRAVPAGRGRGRRGRGDHHRRGAAAGGRRDDRRTAPAPTRCAPPRPRPRRRRQRGRSSRCRPPRRRGQSAAAAAAEGSC